MSDARAPTLRGLFDSPELFPYAIDWESGRVRLARMSGRDSYQRFAFHFPQYLEAGETQVFQCDLGVLMKLLESQPPPPRPIRYIFHMTAGASTLLSRCLDAIAGTVVLKEPFPLTSLVRRRAGGGDPALWARQLSLIAALYSRSYGPNEVAIVKTHQITSQILPELLAPAQAAGLQIYQDLELFLAQFFKKESRMAEVRPVLDWHLPGLTLHAGRDPVLDPGRLAKVEVEELSDAQAVALLWLCSWSNYANSRGLEAFQRMRAVNSRTFLEKPRETLRSIAAHFGISVPESMLEDIVASDLFTSNAKNQRKKFDLSEYNAELDRVLEKFHVGIREGVAFARGLLVESSIPGRWPQEIGAPES